MPGYHRQVDLLMYGSHGHVYAMKQVGVYSSRTSSSQGVLRKTCFREPLVLCRETEYTL